MNGLIYYDSHRESLCGFLLRSKADIAVELNYERGVTCADR